jgi:hypothetical protein
MPREWFSSMSPDWITSELVMRLPEADAESLLVKHWEDLRFCPDFVQAALCLTTDHIVRLVRLTVGECPSPEKLFEHLWQHFGLCNGVTREAQIQALAEYFGSRSVVPSMPCGWWR